MDISIQNPEQEKKDEVFDINKIGFVILHYLVFETTKKCVESIMESVDTNQYCIIIVDNGSGNGSGEKLQALYKGHDNITVVLNSQNLGFARGNNVGFKYAKEIEKCDFICMMNNDTILEQKDFSQSIVNEYKNYDCAVMGPQVLMSDNTVILQARKLGTVKMYQRELLRLHIAEFMIKFGIDISVFPKLVRKILKKEIKAYFPVSVENGIIENVVLEGCCLIFTPIYLRMFDGIDDRTFMYREEELLYVRLMKHHLKSLYSEKIHIKHLEDVSTDSAMTSDREKKKFIYKNEIQSLKILILEMQSVKM